MTISAVVPDIAFTGSGGAGTLGPFSLVKSGTPLVFFANSEVVVLRYDTVTDTTPTLLVEGTDYDLTGGPTAGSITLTSPQTGLLTLERLYVTTLSALAQSLDLVNGGNFSSSNLERRLDVIFQILQQHDREIKSTMRFAMFDTDEIPKTTPLGVVIDKIPYVTGTAASPTVAYLDALVLNNLSELSVTNLANIALVAADLSGADTIGIVATDLAGDDAIGTVATNIADVSSVAVAIAAGTIPSIDYGTYAEMRALSVASAGGLDAFIVTDRGGPTTYQWVSGDQSASVSADEVASSSGDGGLWVAPTAAATGASGAWSAVPKDATSVIDYGATGDGTTDDTAAIQAAITAANATTHKRLYFPAGAYSYREQLVIHSGATWFGDGANKSILALHSAAANIIPIKTNLTATTTKAITSITSASTTATVTTGSAHGYTTGDVVRIIGASPIAYIGEYTITVTGSTTFTYTFAGSGTSPATGTITCAEVIWNQTDIALYDLHIKGYDAVLTTTADQLHASLTRLWSIDGLTIERCKFSGHRFIMLSIGGVKNFSINDCEFEDWGRTDDLASSGTLPANEGGSAIWCAANPIDGTPSTFGSICGNYLHDAEWSCVYLLGQNINFSFNRMENYKEGNFAASTSIFVSVLPAGSESYNITYVGNFHKGVTERLIAAAGFECGAVGAIIANNYFEDCVAAGVDITDAAENCVVIGNTLINCATSGDFLQYASITARLTNITAKACNGITISNNVIRSSAGNYGIRLYRASGSDTFNNIRVVNNDLVGAAADSADNLVYTTGHLGTNVVLKDNSGASDYVPASSTWTPTIAATSGTITTSSTPTARYNIVGNMVFFTIVITVTDNGTGAATLTFTLPSTPAYAGTAVGRNASTGRAVSATWATTTTANVNFATSLYPVANGQSLRISGMYLEA